MGRVEMPRSLTKKKFNERIKFLKESGGNLTFENIDPNFYKECIYDIRKNYLSMFIMIVLFICVLTFLYKG